MFRWQTCFNFVLVLPFTFNKYLDYVVFPKAYPTYLPISRVTLVGNSHNVALEPTDSCVKRLSKQKRRNLLSEPVPEVLTYRWRCALAPAASPRPSWRPLNWTTQTKRLVETIYGSLTKTLCLCDRQPKADLPNAVQNLTIYAAGNYFFQHHPRSVTRLLFCPRSKSTQGY